MAVVGTSSSPPASVTSPPARINLSCIDNISQVSSTMMNTSDLSVCGGPDCLAYNITNITRVFGNIIYSLAVRAEGAQKDFAEVSEQ